MIDSQEDDLFRGLERAMDNYKSGYSINAVMSSMRSESRKAEDLWNELNRYMFWCKNANRSRFHEWVRNSWADKPDMLKKLLEW